MSTAIDIIKSEIDDFVNDQEISARATQLGLQSIIAHCEKLIMGDDDDDEEDDDEDDDSDLDDDDSDLDDSDLDEE